MMAVIHHDVTHGSGMVLVLLACALTLLAHVFARIFAKYLPNVPMVVTAMMVVLLMLFVLSWDYHHYYQVAKPVFDHLLGYVTVLLAIPLASMNFKGLPIKRLSMLAMLATLVGALLPMGLAWAWALSHDTVLSFATRAVTTPVGLSVASIIGAPLTMANLIIIVSGVVGAVFGRILLKNVQDDRAKGLAMGMMAHAFGTVEAWQISPVAGRYAAFGLAVNGLLTAVWLPFFMMLC